MRNQAQWVPSKYVVRRGRLRGARSAALGPGSRLMADLIARCYEQTLPTYARGDLLDLGCGEAPLYVAYGPLADSVTCVDWADNPYLDFTCDLTQRLPFDDASFDTIVLSDVLEHIPNPEHLWSEMSRIVRPQGTVIVNVPFFYWIHAHPHDFHRYTRFALERLAQLNGLEVRVLEPLGGVSEVAADISAKLAGRLPGLGRPVASAVQAAALGFNRTALGRRSVAVTADYFPLGYFMVAQRPALDD